MAGPQDSVYALQAVNLIRSVDLFSSRPVVVVAGPRSSCLSV